MIGEYLRNETSGGALGRFTRDLTADARAGRLEPVRCREQEVSRVIDILLRHGKNNPTLVGPAGVGKTAIAEGLAQRIAAEAVPIVLKSVRLLSLDHVALLAGTTYRGQYEERIRALFREGVEQSELRTDLDVSVAALVFLSAANWAYTWLQPGRDTDELADRFYVLLIDGMRGYATPD